MQVKQLFNLLDGTGHGDPYPVLTELESVCASWHKDTMARWYPWQGSSEPEQQELKHTLSFEQKTYFRKRIKKVDDSIDRQRCAPRCYAV